MHGIEQQQHLLRVQKLLKCLKQQEKSRQVRNPTSRKVNVRSLRQKVIRATAQKKNLKRQLGNVKRQLNELTDQKLDKVLEMLASKGLLSLRHWNVLSVPFQKPP